jgi:hypothetical protein
MALKSVLEKFQKVKETIKEEKEKKNNSYENELVFKPVHVKGEEKTKFKLRFLEVAESSTGKPWVQLNYHMFERLGDGKYVKVIDPRSPIFGNPKAENPISDRASELFKSDNPLDKDLAKKMFKKARYFTLVYVKEAPESQKEYEGKVLIYEAGKQIFDKLDSAINDYDMCFWDPYQGRDFLLVLKTKGQENWPDYTESNWIGVDGPISKDEKVMEKIGEQLEKITIKKGIIEKEGVKSGDELLELLDGGLKKKEGSAKKPVSKPTKELTSNETVDETISADVDFGEVKEEEKPKENSKKPVSESKKKEEEITDFDINFDESDFDIK